MGRDHLVVFTIARSAALIAFDSPGHASITRDKSGSAGVGGEAVLALKSRDFSAFSSILSRKYLELQGSVAGSIPACLNRPRQDGPVDCGWPVCFGILSKTPLGAYRVRKGAGVDGSRSSIGLTLIQVGTEIRGRSRK